MRSRVTRSETRMDLAERWYSWPTRGAEIRSFRAEPVPEGKVDCVRAVVPLPGLHSRGQA
jgi:hypothetical protein